MPPLTTAGWGCAGGAAAAAVVYVLPLLTHAVLTGETNVARGRVIAMSLLVMLLAVIAGLVALIPDDLTRGGAISYGLASQTTLKGLISTVMDAFPESVRPPPMPP